MDGDIRTNTYDDGSTDAQTGEQKIRNLISTSVRNTLRRTAFCAWCLSLTVKS